MSHLIVYDGQVTQFAESDKSPIGRLAITAGKCPPNRIHQNIGSFAEMNKILSNSCPRVVPCNFGPLIENWEDLSAVRTHKRVSSASTLPAACRKSILQKPRLIELATYPGYVEYEPTPLPFSLQAAHILTDVIDAQAHLKKKPRFTEYCRRNLLDVKIHKIFLDLFWFLFLDLYNQNKFVQQNIFIRTANTYGDFFSLLDNDSRFKDAFLQIQLDLLSQAVFTVFIRAYPTSSKQFDDNFKSKICDLIHFWFSGLPPFPNSFKSWPIDKLAQDNILQRNSIDVHSSYGEDNLGIGTKKPEIPREKGKQRKFVLSQKPESHPIHGPSYTLQRTLLRTTGHSPLMDYYLSSRQMVPPSSHSMLLSHSHALPPHNTTSLTYFDFLKRYNKRAQNRRNKMYEIMRTTDEKILKRRVEQERQLKTLAGLAKQIPVNREELRFLRQRLVLHIMSDQFGESKNTNKKENTPTPEQQATSQPEP